MNEQIKQLLPRIYNTMCLISTKGEDTLLMSDCLRALNDIINQLNETTEIIPIPGSKETPAEGE